jgi:hypothetical protein
LEREGTKMTKDAKRGGLEREGAKMTKDAKTAHRAIILPQLVLAMRKLRVLRVLHRLRVFAFQIDTNMCSLV